MTRMQRISANKNYQKNSKLTLSLFVEFLVLFFYLQIKICNYSSKSESSTCHLITHLQFILLQNQRQIFEWKKLFEFGFVKFFFINPAQAHFSIVFAKQ